MRKSRYYREYNCVLQDVIHDELPDIGGIMIVITIRKGYQIIVRDKVNGFKGGPTFNNIHDAREYACFLNGLHEGEKS